MTGEQVPAANVGAEESASARIERGVEYPCRCQTDGEESQHGQRKLYHRDHSAGKAGLNCSNS